VRSGHNSVLSCVDKVGKEKEAKEKEKEKRMAKKKKKKKRKVVEGGRRMRKGELGWKRKVGQVAKRVWKKCDAVCLLLLLLWPRWCLLVVRVLVEAMVVLIARVDALAVA